MQQQPLETQILGQAVADLLDLQDFQEVEDLEL
jgi:hypothetical protein